MIPLTKPDSEIAIEVVDDPREPPYLYFEMMTPDGTHRARVYSPIDLERFIEQLQELNRELSLAIVKRLVFGTKDVYPTD